MNFDKIKASFIEPRQPSIDRRYRPIPQSRVNLFQLSEEELYDCDTESTESEKNSIGTTISCAGTSSPENIVEGALIYLRMRPTKDENCDYYTISNNTLITKNNQNNERITEKHFSFTDIFSGSVSQSKIYETCVKNKIREEENFTVMTYGTSGSGKTFTLIGDLENPGIFPRALENIFQMYNKNIKNNPSLRIKNGEIFIEDDEDTNKTIIIHKQLLNNCCDVKNFRVEQKILTENNFEKNNSNNCTVSVWISFIEIYNEIVYDLLELDSKTRKPLKIITNNGKVFIKNLTSTFVDNSLEAYKLLTYGLKRVSYASTSINTNSSRSHCIFFVDIIKFNELTKKIKHISYKFCDLAGSERICKTGNVGNRLKEAQRINTSLMVLGRCLDAASNNHNKKNPDVIPIRDSKLTMILQTPLLGNEKISMIVNITPTEQYYEENLNVLGFSSIAKNIYYKPCEQKRKQTRFSWFANTMSGTDDLSSQRYDELSEENISLKNEVERLQEIIINLEQKLENQEKALRTELVDSFEEELKKRSKRFDEHLLTQERNLRESFQAQKQSLKRYYEKKLLEKEDDDYDDDDDDDDIQLIENDSDDDDENENSKENSEPKKMRVESV